MKKNIFSSLRHPFFVQYRISITSAGRTINTFGLDRRILVNMARNTQDMDCWTLYKRGPFGIHERPVDHGIRQQLKT